MRWSRDRTAVRVALALVVAGLLLFAFRGPLARGFASVAFDLATGDRMSLGDLSLGSSHITMRDLVVSRGASRLAARAVDVRYDLRELILGRGSRYGLHALELVEPSLDLTRNADGSFDFPGPTGAGPGPGTAPASERPLRFSLIVRAGSVRLHDRFRRISFARELSLRRVAGSADVDTAGRTAYRMAGRFSDGGNAFAIAGRIGADGFALHRLHAATVDFAPLADYFINSPPAAILRGRARDVDVRLYALAGGPSEAPAYHLAGSAYVVNAAMRVPGLAV
ncbi:MAG: hypothetical protein IAI49_15025, partial [Candidatus Eremiobacteraeota bacterium]|nr:hypothetical protein [Candidatus Eremiobacteraeota bacterium]